MTRCRPHSNFNLAGHNNFPWPEANLSSRNIVELVTDAKINQRTWLAGESEFSIFAFVRA